MRAFLNQFELPKMVQLRFESFMFRLADQMIEGYSGGTWKTTHLGGSVIVKIPTDAKTVTLTSPISGATAELDTHTASVIFSFLAACWFWESHVESMSDVSFEAFSNYRYGIKNSVFIDNSKVNDQAFYNFTD